jgi:hypothetical protein
VCGASIWVFVLLAASAWRTWRAHPSFSVAGYAIPTWSSPLLLSLLLWVLVPQTSLLGHLCACAVGYGWGSGYLKFLAPPEKAVRWLEARLNLLARVPKYVSVDQKVYGRYGVLPSMSDREEEDVERGAGIGLRGTGPEGRTLGA